MARRPKTLLDFHFNSVFAENKNMMVPYYLIASYGYYEDNFSIISDHLFDSMAKTMLDEWDSIEHFHKSLITKNDLEAGTYLGKYPNRVIGGYHSLLKEQLK